VSFRVEDKVRLALELDRLGVDVIECGWPSANPKDMQVIKTLRREYTVEAKIAAFTSTRRPGRRVEDDPIVVNTLRAEPDVVVVFGKAWTLHVTEVLRTSLEENLRMIEDTILFFKDHGLDVIFDAEHFFDGYKQDPDYAMKVVKLADELKVHAVVLCDTNGGCLPHEVHEIVRKVADSLKNSIVGVHLHNDSGCAVANTLMAVLAGARHVQVTVNGIGERCGNADLCQVLPNLILKLNVRTRRISSDKLRGLTYLSKLVYELTGLPRNPYQPYVGENAFTHKAGVHVDAVLKCPRAYEHVNPEAVGNTRRFVVSDLSGAATIICKVREILKVDLSKDDPRVRSALMEIKSLEERGLSFDDATASAVLIILKHLGLYRKMFEIVDWRVVCEGLSTQSRAWAWVKVKADDRIIIEAGEGLGPVHAADVALRNALAQIYPEVNNVTLIDYKVTLLGIPKHTASTVRVNITFRAEDMDETWTTTSASTNIVEASIDALAQGIDYYLQLRNIR